MKTIETNSIHPLSETMKGALELPSGARFYRCALQINPFAYLKRHGKQTSFESESSYNKAIIETCTELRIKVIGVTDHYRIQDSRDLLEAARHAGIWAFGGFEAVTKDGVHFLCLFDPDKDKYLERYIGDCGVHDHDQESPTGSLDCIELLEKSKNWGAACIAAHAASNGGLFQTLSGQSRINVWTSPNLLACILPGPVDNAPSDIIKILKNKNPQYKRPNPVAVINASDVNSPDDLKKDSASCYIKMSDVSVEALRQAFLDPESRIRLHSDPPPEAHTELLAMAWEGGFLRDTLVHFNGNLNAVVGGRGTGKSTMVESIRYVLGLDPVGGDAQKAHEGVIRHVLRSGTKISLMVKSHKPSECYYTIERSVPNPPVVKSSTGEVLSVSPRDVMSGVEVYGQHEISELTKSGEKLTLLLERFMNRDPSILGRKAKLQLDLKKSRSRIVDVQRELKTLEERLLALPGLEETEKRFRQAGLEERLKEKSLLIKEERLFLSLDERLKPFRELYSSLAEGLPIDTAFVSGKALKGLPNSKTLEKIENVLESLSTRLGAVSKQFASALAETDTAISKIKAQWDKERAVIEETYEKLLRDLQKSKIDGEEFIQLRKQIEDLRPLKDQMESLKRDLATHKLHRHNLVTEWEDIKALEFREIENAARKVSKKLKGRIRVNVTMAGNRDPLKQILREVGGNLAAAFERLDSEDHLSLTKFVWCCREGKEFLMDVYKLPPGAAERIAQADIDLLMRIEELELPATTRIELNTSAEGDADVWQKLEELSKGQKATAVLLLLLLESDAPLIVDQPEDDLDNRFITEGVVPIMRQEKRRRQFIFSTHNANIPVLGDAELILGLAASGEAKEGQARIAPEHMGSIDSQPVRELVEEILEGGKDAFEMRRSKYGF